MKLPVLLIIACLIGCGCSTIRYTYNGKNYGSSEEALAAHAKDIDGIVSEVAVRKDPINAKVLIVTPNSTTTSSIGINRKGTPAQPIIDFLGIYMERDFAARSKALQKSNAFTTVDARIAEFPVKEARASLDNYAAVVYLNMISPTQVGWYLLKSQDAPPVQINTDAMAKGAQRTESWIDSIVSEYRK